MKTNTKAIKDLILEVQEGDVPPQRLVEIAVELSSWAATLGNDLKDILVFKADRWLVMRPDYKSDKATDRNWDATDEGKDEIILRSQLKYIDKVVSNIKLMLKVLMDQSWGVY